MARKKLDNFQNKPTQQTQTTEDGAEDGAAVNEGQQGSIQLKHKLEDFRAKKEDLLQELKKAETEENSVRAEKDDFEKKVLQMEQLDILQHTNVMICLHDNLKDEEVDSLKMVLRNNQVLTRNEQDTIKSFYLLWRTLADKDYVSVGNYTALRTDIETIHLKQLAVEIAEMEDGLLKRYDHKEGKTLNELHDAQFDTFTKRLDRQFKSIKEEEKAYKEPGGPFKYLKHVMTVAKHYLGELEEKSQSSKALETFVKDHLKRNDILSAGETHAKEHKQRKSRSQELESKLNTANSEIGRLTKDIAKQKEKYEKERTELDKQLTKAVNSLDSEKKNTKKIEEENKKKADKAKQSWEEWKKKLEEENTRLCLETENTNKWCHEILYLMDGFTQYEVERFEEKEREKDGIRAEEVKKDRLRMQEMEEKLSEEQGARHRMVQDSIHKRQKLCEDYENKLIVFAERALVSRTKIREESREQLVNLQAECGKSLVSQSVDLMALRRELLKANLNNMFDKYEIGECDRKIKNLERKLSLANARIDTFQGGRQE